ncbi:hypothetical protein L249_5163 [Ophiocordyceps polyrhachis-furcata BCC 54312]|uniref:Uncharacterized protein n=1 Tax=Ophiocordyceps polyrhachis-furcata BCC 54312 TaxID=1330021 RepID=A0A367L9M1_9HYPO|nr:hypothetical protein L249_5163 [Ophiocordyceps polyrhachis-furcata BCC 54312]
MAFYIGFLDRRHGESHSLTAGGLDRYCSRHEHGHGQEAFHLSHNLSIGRRIGLLRRLRLLYPHLVVTGWGWRQL